MFVWPYVFWIGVFCAMACFAGMIAREYFRVTPVKPLACKRTVNIQEDIEYVKIPRGVLVSRNNIVKGSKEITRELPRIPKPAIALLERITEEHPAVFPTTGSH